MEVYPADENLVSLQKTLWQTKIEETKIYPLANNPFDPNNGPTAVVYDLKEGGNVVLEIYNLAGERVCVLVNGYRARGRHRIYWNGGNGEFNAKDTETIGSSNILSSGIYIIVLRVNNKVVKTTKIAIIKWRFYYLFYFYMLKLSLILIPIRELVRAIS